MNLTEAINKADLSQYEGPNRRPFRGTKTSALLRLMQYSRRRLPYCRNQLVSQRIEHILLLIQGELAWRDRENQSAG